MARTNLPITSVSRVGVAPAAEVNGDVANNHSFVNDGKTVLLVRNAHATVDYTVSVLVNRKVDGLTVAPLVHTVTHQTSLYLGPYPIADYGQVVSVDVDAASGTNLKLSAYRVS